MSQKYIYFFDYNTNFFIVAQEYFIDYGNVPKTCHKIKLKNYITTNKKNANN